MHIHMYIYIYMYIHVYTYTHPLDCKFLECAVRAQFFSRTYMSKQYCICYIYTCNKNIEYCNIFATYALLLCMYISILRETSVFATSALLLCMYISVFICTIVVMCTYITYAIDMRSSFHGCMLLYVHIVICTSCHIYILSYVQVTRISHFHNVCYICTHDNTIACIHRYIHTKENYFCQKRRRHLKRDLYASKETNTRWSMTQNLY